MNSTDTTHSIPLAGAFANTRDSGPGRLHIRAEEITIVEERLTKLSHDVDDFVLHLSGPWEMEEDGPEPPSPTTDPGSIQDALESKCLRLMKATSALEAAVKRLQNSL